MADEANPPNNEQPATPPAAAAQQPTASVLASPEVQAAIKAEADRARNAAWAEARRQFEGKQRQPASDPPAQSQPATNPQTAPVTTSSLDIARVVMFTTEAAKHGVPPKGVELLLSRLDAEKPSDVSAWVAQQAADFGWKQTTTPPTSTPAAPANAPASATTAAASMPPVTANAAPSSTARVTDDVPLIDRSASDQAAFVKQYGFVAFTDRVTREARERNTRLRLR